MKDAELRTGLTAKEVGQFGFAARAVGQDISIVERLMRGLSQAANDNSNEGEKARATLRAMGIDFHAATALAAKKITMSKSSAAEIRRRRIRGDYIAVSSRFDGAFGRMLSYCV